MFCKDFFGCWVVDRLGGGEMVNLEIESLFRRFLEYLSKRMWFELGRWF